MDNKSIRINGDAPLMHAFNAPDIDNIQSRDQLLAIGVRTYSTFRGMT